MKIDDLCNTDKIAEKLSLIMSKYNHLSSELRVTFRMMKKNKEEHDKILDNLTVENFPQDFFNYKIFLINNSEKITGIIEELEDIKNKIYSIKTP